MHLHWLFILSTQLICEQIDFDRLTSRHKQTENQKNRFNILKKRRKYTHKTYFIISLVSIQLATDFKESEQKNVW